MQENERIIKMEDIRHGVRVAGIATNIARAKGYSDRKIRQLEIAGILHDIGKADIKKEILDKPGKLTEQEREEVKKHVLYSVEEVLKMGYPKEIANMVREHHENWDGSGYPKGLIGDKITKEGRILKVADVYDALTSERPYRRALSHAEAIEIMKKEKHTFDPIIFEIFLNLFQEESEKVINK